MTRYSDISVRDASGNVTLDFSHFHDLDHSIFHCYDWVEHLRLWWSYRGEEMVIGALIGIPWRLFGCSSGRHRWLPTLDLRTNSNGAVCAWCETRQ